MADILLTPADVRRLEEVKEQIDQAIAGKKRVTQAIPLLEAQEKLMQIVTWFMVRDLE